MQVLDVKHNVSLKPFNTFGIEAIAPYYVCLYNTNQVPAILSFVHQNKLILKLLGGGSNILIGDLPANTMVVHVQLNHINLLAADEFGYRVSVGAGVNWHAFVNFALAHGWHGLENLALIPGTCGAAPMQNIGAYGVEVKELIESVSGINLLNNTHEIYPNEACNFGYRTSIFKQALKDCFLITEVCFYFKRNSPLKLNYQALSERLEQMYEPPFNHAQLAEAVIAIRKEKLPNPAEIGNAGSFFKNPTIDLFTFEKIKNKYKDIPGFQVGESSVKLSAAWLIEQCGFKGKQYRQTGTFNKHALVLVNHGNALGQEIWDYALHIQTIVADKFGVMLEPEVNKW